MTTSSAETLARHRKAVKLVRLFKRAGVTPGRVRAMAERGWQIAAQMTGTKIASQTTRDLVCEILSIDADGGALAESVMSDVAGRV